MTYTVEVISKELCWTDIHLEPLLLKESHGIKLKLKFFAPTINIKVVTQWFSPLAEERCVTYQMKTAKENYLSSHNLTKTKKNENILKPVLH